MSLTCFQVGIFPDIIERKVMRHFEEGDHVRLLYILVCHSIISHSYKLIRVEYVCVWEGFSISNWRILYQEGAFSRICTTFCVQCGGFAEVGVKIF